MSRAAARVIERVPDRVAALRRFVDLTAPYLPPATLDPARELAVRTGDRLALSRSHTVVALAGSTGSGKSSIFNAFAGTALSEVGLRRPTTGVAHACVWAASPDEPSGEPVDGAARLLDWLGVGRRFAHGAEPGMAGLVLLDLPDFDSVEAAHRIEADRLLSLVDLVVWVLDPQKYADKVVHRQYLARFRHHRDITVVVLNQADRLGPDGVRRCLVDLRQLLQADGLDGVTTLAASTVGPPGLPALRGQLEQTVAARTAALQRLAADVDSVVADLAPIMGAPAAVPLDRDLTTRLHQALGAAAGVPLVAQATQRAYVHRAVRHTGWPVTRWLRRTRADPLSRLRLGRRNPSDPAASAATTDPATTGPDGAGQRSGGSIGASSIGPAAPAAKAAVGLALRAVGDHCGLGLAAPWPDAVLNAARSRQADLPDALDLAIAQTDLGLSRAPVWWRAVGALQLVLFVAGVAGVGWLLVRYALFALALPEPPMPAVGRVPWPTLLLIGGLLGGLLLALVSRPFVNAAARRRRRRVTKALERAVGRVADSLVVTPVDAVAAAYADARAALTEATRS